MNKAELQELTRLGVRQKLEAVQRYLARIHQEFPEMFATPTPPVFMRAEEKQSGNNWPTFTATKGSDNGDSSDTETPARKWSPAARAAAAKRARERHNNPPGPWGSLLYQRILDFLLTCPQREARLIDIANALKVLPSSTRSAVVIHKELFRQHNNVWRLIKVRDTRKRKTSGKPTRKAVAHHTSKGKQKATPKTWGVSAWHRVHDFLATQPKQTAPLTAIMPTCGISTHAAAITGMQVRKDLFKRVSQGTYALNKELSAEEKLKYAPGK